MPIQHMQTLQDELISKSFSGREGRGLYVTPPHSNAPPSISQFASLCGQHQIRQERGPTIVVRHLFHVLSYSCIWNFLQDRGAHSESHPNLMPICASESQTCQVQDVFCMGCNDRIGWFYHKAADTSQKYKEGAPSPSCFAIFRGNVIQANIFSSERSLLKRTSMSHITTLLFSLPFHLCSQ